MGLQWHCVDLDKGIVMIKQALLYTKDKGVYVGAPPTSWATRMPIPPKLSMPTKSPVPAPKPAASVQACSLS